MTNKEFIKIAKDIEAMSTAYAWGTFGQKKTDSFIDSKMKQYPKWYNATRVQHLKAQSNDTYLFDCVGLIKAILWGFPNIRYVTNGVPDINANTMIEKCSFTSTDFSNIIEGSVVWMDGHIGIYIGNGQVIECTPSFDNKVCRTNLNQRKWLKWGRLPYIDYVINEDIKINTDSKLNSFIEELERLIRGYK